MGTNNFIQGIPKLQWGKWQDCTFAGSVTIIFNRLGLDVTYEDIMGLSGSCYRICTHKNFCPSATMPQVGFDVETPLNKALGLKTYSLDDSTLRIKKVIESIDNGIPVLGGGISHEPEWSLITGYQNNGEQFFGRSYFDYIIPNDDCIATDDRYFLAEKYPGFCIMFYEKDNTTHALTKKNALKQSLECCINFLNNIPSRGDYTFGYEAYEMWIKELKNNKYDNTFNAEGNRFYLDTLRDARRSAKIYLEKHIDLLNSKNNNLLKDAINIYEAIFDKLMKVDPPYKRINGELPNDNTTYNIEQRIKLADTLGEIAKMEKEIENKFRQILNNWK